MNEPGTVKETQRFDEVRLAEYMAAHIYDFKGPLSVSQFSGGQSNPTYKIETQRRSYVLRRKPAGNLMPSAHAIDREFRVIRALSQTEFPVPRTYLFCDDTDVIGSAFYVMEFVPGRVFWNHRMPDLMPSDRGKVLQSLCVNLAKLHSLDYRALGLEDFGRPGNYFARQVSRWTKTYRANETSSIEAMNRLIDWLPTAIPDDDSVSLVHGDYALHNVLFHPVEPEMVAALDWELATVGHPLGDLFYSGIAYYMPELDQDNPGGYLDIDCSAHGIPTFEEYLDLYCESAGREPIQNPNFYKAFNLFRLAGISQGIVGRISDGTANDPNADVERQAKRVIGWAEAGWLEAQRAGAE